MTITLETGLWVELGPLDLVQPERGVAMLLRDGRQVAVFRTYDGQVHAIGNVDPRSGAAVLSRGIVGDRGGEPTVASPMYKEVYALRTGRCLDDPALAVPVYPARVRAGTIEIDPQPRTEIT